jgi:hypothetical protein
MIILAIGIYRTRNGHNIRCAWNVMLQVQGIAKRST